MNDNRRKRYALQEREQILERFAASGLSASRFCKEEGLTYPTLKNWMNKSKPAAEIPFVEIETEASSGSAVRLRFDSGIELELAADSERTVIEKWIRLLRSC